MGGRRNNVGVLGPGESRRMLAQRLRSAYADGLLSEATLTYRLERALTPGVIDVWSLIGDLSLRRSSRSFLRTRVALPRGLERLLAGRAGDDGCPLLALDWHGAVTELTIGRRSSCDVVLHGEDVSRQHARLLFRDGQWILQDLGSLNGTTVNGVPVGRCRLQPGDLIRIGRQELRID